jgi:hypothetical protein
MPDVNILPELFEKPNEEFTAHLNLQDNYRILFSGKFGIGKTTFIKHFFGSNDNYNVIHLFPVKYSLLENEDVFSYLKYDILVSLFDNKEYPLKEDYYSFLKTWDSFMLNNLGQVIATTMLLIPKMGKQLNLFTGQLKQLATDFKEYKDNKRDRELNEVNHFLKQFHEAEGGIYETNVITTIIQEWLRDIKNQGIQNMLVIDDLDRIDPTHIFRLLNVFSAHFDSRDQEESKNKFGFDKVIFVCDIENIRSIYNSRFGIKTDFIGYVDKFYSKNIFRFDNRESILSILGKIISSIYIDYYFKKTYYNGRENRHPDIVNIRDTVILILQKMIQYNVISLRSLFKHYEEHVDLNRYDFLIYGVNINPSANFFLAAINILLLFVGDMDLLKDKLSQIKDFSIKYEDHPQLFIGSLVLLKDINSTSGKVLHRTHYKPIRGISFDFNFESGYQLSGKYSLHTPQSQRNSISYTGYIEELLLNGSQVNFGELEKSQLNIIDLFQDVVQNISL